MKAITFPSHGCHRYSLACSSRPKVLPAKTQFWQRKVTVAETHSKHVINCPNIVNWVKVWLTGVHWTKFLLSACVCGGLVVGSLWLTVIFGGEGILKTLRCKIAKIGHIRQWPEQFHTKTKWSKWILRSLEVCFLCCRHITAFSSDIWRKYILYCTKSRMLYIERSKDLSSVVLLRQCAKIS